MMLDPSGGFQDARGFQLLEGFQLSKQNCLLKLECMEVISNHSRMGMEGIHGCGLL